MPPKKKGKTVPSPSPAPAPPPLEACTIALSGAFPGRSHYSLEQNLITPLGASLAKTITSSTTHLVTTDADFAKPSAKVKQAQANDISIVKLAWLEDCLGASERLNDDDYGFDATADAKTAAAPANGTANGTANGSLKRAAADGSDSDSQSQPKKKSKAVIDTSTDDAKPDSKPTKKRKSELVVDGQFNVLKPGKKINIPLDETCPLTNYAVYIDGNGVIYDASLNQTNSSNNNNKFYRVQLLHNGSDYKTWTRWGRVGERGSSSILGNGSLDDAIRQFDTKFRSKSGLPWDKRGDQPKPNKYTLVEKSYEPDSENEEEDLKLDVKTGEKLEMPKSKLEPAIQELLWLVFNQQFFAAAMTEFNYDANKLPLGKLGKNTILRGYQALKDLSALLDDATLAQSQYGTTYQNACEQLSNYFYSLIPHSFGRNRPPIIHQHDLLKKELDLLQSLGDMKDAASIMKSIPQDVESINALDQQFRGLNLDEMTPLKCDSQEFSELKNYLVETRGATHNANYQVEQIFRIARQGEKERFNKSKFAGPPRDRRLLWHGSRCTNFGGILSQGLRIAPPEAPASGYMFGKGLYLADMSSKSANYCCPYISNGHALLLLCEAELDHPMQTLTSASYSADLEAKAKGISSTWGQGMTGPSVWKDAECVHPSLKGVKMPDITVPPGPTGVNHAYLMYNEYIAYDVSQVRLRYLFRVRM